MCKRLSKESQCAQQLQKTKRHLCDTPYEPKKVVAVGIPSTSEPACDKEQQSEQQPEQQQDSQQEQQQSSVTNLETKEDLEAAESSSEHEQEAGLETSEILPAPTGDELSDIASCSAKRTLHTKAAEEEELLEDHTTKEEGHNGNNDVYVNERRNPSTAEDNIKAIQRKTAQVNFFLIVRMQSMRRQISQLQESTLRRVREKMHGC